MEELSPRDWFEQTEFTPTICRTCGRSGEEVRLERGHVLTAKHRGGQEWFVQCVECNVKQGDLSLDEWSDGGDKGHRNDTDIRMLVDTYREVQKTRIRLANRIDAKRKRSDTGDTDVLEAVLDSVQPNEAKLKRAIGRYIRDLCETDAYARVLIEAPGVGGVLAARMLAEIDWSHVNSLDGLYLFCGYAPGEDKMVKHKVRRFSLRLKISIRNWTTGIKMGRNRVAAFAAYGQRYEWWKATSLANPKHAEWSPGHHDNYALRMMAKEFISHMYLAHLALHKGVNGNRAPQEFGWPEFENA